MLTWIRKRLFKISERNLKIGRVVGKIVEIRDDDYGEYSISKAVSPIGCPKCGKIIHTMEEHNHGPIA